MAIATECADQNILAESRAYPLSIAQEAIWLDLLVNRAAVNYAIGVIFLLEGELNPELLNEAFALVAQQSDALRIVLADQEGSPAQRLAESAAPCLKTLDLSGLPTPDERARELLQSAIDLPFDLHSGPLCETQIVRVGATRHYWMLRFHHLAVDGGSFALVLRAVARQYERLLAGERTPIHLPSYVQAVLEDWQYRESEVHAADRKFWRERFRAVPEDALCNLRKPGARPGSARRRHYVTVERKALERVAAQTCASGLSIAHFMIAICAICLARLNGSRQTIIGVALHNRSNRVHRGTIGMFSSIVPVAIEVDPQATFTEILRAAWSELKRCAMHSRVSLAQINRDLQLTHTQRQQLIDVTLSVESWPLNVTLGPAHCRVVNSYRGAQHAALAISIIDYGSDGDVPVELAYDPGVLDDATVESIGASLLHLIEGCPERANEPIARMPLLGSRDRAHVLNDFNPDACALQPLLLHQLFEQQAQATPLGTALVFEDHDVDYAQLDAMANRIAGVLRERGVEIKTCVALCAERSIEAIAGMLGIWKAGCAYVPLDPNQPSERIAAVLADCGAPIVLAQRALGLQFPKRTLRLNLEDALAAPGGPRIDFPQEAKEDAVAYVIYTSGSTGRPKGVVGTHAGMVNRIRAQEKFDPIQDDDVCCQRTSIGFVDSIFEILGPLTKGRRLVIAPSAIAADPHALGTLIRDRGVSRLISVPSLARALVEADELHKLAGLKSWTLSGEALASDLLQQLQHSLPNCKFVNLYGSSEIAADATCFLAVDWDGGCVPIGRPIQNTRVYILDALMQPVPAGVTGEIYIAGAGVALGYLNLPALTAERFMVDPFVAGANARMFKTGDLGRWRRDGAIEYIGRNDHQVKIRGVRIDPGEIEAHLTRQPGIQQAVVMAREDVTGDKRLVAYVVADRTAPSADRLRDCLRRVLPESMVPYAYVSLERFALTPSGKIDRKALPAPSVESLHARGYEPARGALERTVAQIWADLLHVERVGRHDNFFDLGGHSLLIVQVIDRLKREGVRTEMATHFTAPTLAALCEAIEQASGNERDILAERASSESRLSQSQVVTSLRELDQEQRARIAAKLPGGESNLQNIYPLTALQEGLVFHHMLNERGDTYLFPTLLELDSRAQLDRFLDALQGVIDRHEALRSAIVWRDLPRPVQVVWRRARLPIAELHFEGDEHSVLHQLTERMAPEHLRVDLEQAPLVRVQVAPAASSGRWYALLVQHHLVSDHASQQIVLAEVTAQLEGRGQLLKPPPAYGDFVADAMLRARHADAEKYFRERLGDVAEPTAPFGLLDVRGDGSRFNQAQETLNPSVARTLRALAGAAGVSTSALFHLAWALVVARASGRDDPVFGSVLSARLQAGPGADRVVGMFVNTLPVRVRLGNNSVRQMVQQMQLELALLLKHEGASLSDAQRCSSLENGAALFSAVLNYRHGSSVREAQQRAALARHGVRLLARQERSNYPLVLYVDDMDEGFALTVQCDEQIDAQRVMAFMRTSMDSLLRAWRTTPDCPVLDLQVVPPSEQKLLLESFSPPVKAHSNTALIHELFEAQVRRAPEAAAVRCEGRHLSYSQLNARANQLAHYLRDLNVRPGTLVALCVERGIDIVVGILGVMKAGGAYLPLDPSYPKERLHYMLEDAAPLVILTQQAFEHQFSGVPGAVVAIDRQWPEIGGHAEHDLSSSAIGVGEQDLAYVIYTSGSTGRPKGVMVEHRNLVRLFSATRELFDFSQNDVWTLFHSFAFDFSVWELWGALLYGGRVVIVPRLTARSAEEFYALLCRERVTVLNQTPTAFTQLIAAQSNAQNLTHSLRYVIFGGERLQLRTLQPWQERIDNEAVKLVNMYGITETTVHVTFLSLTAAQIQHETASPVGRPLPDLRLYILDRNGRLAPVGVSGEIHVGGAGVARGYLNRDDLTSARFLRDPFSTEPGARMYRTGDLGCWRSDGTVEYLGRNDEQIKIRGFRIEPGEIEAQLCRLGGVREAVVALRDDAETGKRLVAYVVPCEPMRQPVNAELFKLPNGLLLRHLNDYETRQLYEEVFVEQTYLRHGISIGPDACIFDVGANIGMFSLFACNSRADVRLFAFEPAPPAFECLRENIAAYQLPVTPLCCGLADSEREATFHHYPRMSTNSGLYADANAEKDVTRMFLKNRSVLSDAAVEELIADKFDVVTYTCQLRTLSAIIEEHAIERIDLLKIDVEKAEWDILRGIKDEHWPRIRQLVVEVHDIGGRLAQVVGLLKQHGFECTTEEEASLRATGLHQIYATRATTDVSLPSEHSGEIVGRTPRFGSDRSIECISAWRTGLAEVLPEHMLPAAFAIMDSLPLTPSGKVDRKSLPSPALGSYASHRYSAPQGALEQALAQVWQEVLRIEKVGRNANFFELGGHSLLIMGMIEELRRAGLSVQVRDVFDSPVLCVLAEKLKRCEIAGQVVSGSSIPPGCARITPEMLDLVQLSESELEALVQCVAGGAANIQDIYPLAPLQRGILFQHLLYQQTDAYVLAILLEADSKRRQDALLDALQRIIDRHDVLRSAVLWEGLREPVQVVYRHATLPVEEIDVDSSAAPLTQLYARMEPQALRMDLTSAPLLRVSTATDPNSGKHYMLIRLHHIVSDHVGLEIILAELRAFVEGQHHRVSEPLPYRDFLVHALSRARHADAEQFFRRKFGDVDAPTAPFGLLDVHGDGSRIVEHCQAIDEDLARTLRFGARRAGVSAATLFHAGWAVVVGRCSGRDDVVFGTVLLGRWQEGASSDRLVGMLINTLPLRVRLKESSVRDLLMQVQREIGELVDYEHAPLTLAQQCSGLSGGAPLFTALLNYRHSTVDTGSRKDLAGTRVLAVRERTNYPFTLSIDDLGEGFALTVRTDCGLQPQRIASYVLATLAGIVEALTGAAERVPVSELPMISPGERNQLVHQFNDASRDFGGEFVHRMFEAQASRTPDAIALICGNARVSYAQLNGKANRLARLLRAQGVGADRLVALCLPAGIDMVIGLLAVLKAGGAYVPIDPAYPRERIQRILADCSPKVVLTDAALDHARFAGAASVLIVSEQWPRIAGLSDEDLSLSDDSLTPRHLAYVIYTSGSTGEPKGVMVEHRNIASYVADVAARFAVEEGEGSLVATSLSFDLGLTGLYPPLICGRAVRICSAEASALAEELIRHKNLSLVKLTPSHLAVLDQVLSPAQVEGRIRTLVLGGEPLSPSVLQRWRALAPQTRIFNHYGPTECTVGCVAHEIDVRDLHGSTVPIGRPIANCRVYILDDSLQPAPRGVVGELFIGGAGVARGYLNRAEATAASFLPDPFVEDPAARMYRTGDLGLWRDDGVVELIGRRDHQVKIRGFRVELEEIQACLRRRGDVQQAVVVATSDAQSGKRLIAYVTCRKPAPVASELRDYLSQHLPDYMLPSAYVVLDSIPLTPNGKVDRKSLPHPDSAAHAHRNYEAPVGRLEETLAQLWSDLLGVKQVGRGDNFFELGGHSLLVMKLVGQLRQLDLETDVRTIFAGGTLAQLAAALKPAMSDGSIGIPANRIPEGCERITPQMLTLVELQEEQLNKVVERTPGGAGNIQDIYPLAPLQEGILFHHLLNEQGDTYVLPILLEVGTRAQLDALLSALQAVISRHDILRTAVIWAGLPRPVQVVYRQATLPVETLELAANEDHVEQLKRWMQPQFLRMDLTKAPLVRAQVAVDGNTQRWYCILQLHHLVKDHVGLEIILTEVREYIEGRGEQLRAPVKYRDFVARALWRARAHDAEQFFRRKLGDVEEPTAPFGLLDVHGDGSRIEQCREALDAELARGIRAHARRLSVSAATLFHAAWAIVVGRCSAREDVVFGTVLLGRWQHGGEAERAVGMFMNTLPLRLRLADSPVRELIASVQREIVELIEHEQASLALAQRCSSIAGATPLFTALLNYRHSAENAESWMGTGRFVPGARVLHLREVNNYPFSMSVDDLAEGFMLTVQTEHAVEPRRIVTYVQTVLGALVQALEHEPELPVSQLPMLPAEELHDLLDERSGAHASAPRAGLIHRLFELQADRTPEAVAVICKDRQLTFRELNSRANQLAHYLRDRGVGADRAVALCMERSVEMIVALLGVLKAGGAYVPLDPASPGTRLQRMLADADAALILTDAASEAQGQAMQGVLALNVQRTIWSTYSTQNLPVTPTEQPSNLAYVIYTSGSTGEPKGVMVEHASVTALWSAMEAQVHRHAGPCGNTSMNAPLFFDASVQQWIQLLSGRTLILIEEQIRVDPPAFIEFVKRSGLESLDCVPSQLEVLLNAGLLSDPGSRLRQLVIGGEEVHPALWSQLSESERVASFNVYGPTEATVNATVARITRAAPPNIGRPLAHARIYLLDAYRRPVPRGVLGEIYIAGEAVGRGYRNKQALTERAFISDPLALPGVKRMYQTGDHGRWRADGTLEYAGRVDQQQKIRGMRVELGEIESMLYRHPHVRNAAVSLIRNEQRGAQLVAYFTTDDPGSTRAEELHAFLKTCLPEHMVPTAYVALEQLPLRPNGKLDRASLPEPSGNAFVSSSAFREPAGEIEIALAQLWKELLRVPQVGRDDNFFDLGGHSLLVMQLIVRVQEVFGLDLRVRTMFENPVLEALAATIGALKSAREPAYARAHEAGALRESGVL